MDVSSKQHIPLLPAEQTQPSLGARLYHLNVPHRAPSDGYTVAPSAGPVAAWGFSSNPLFCPRSPVQISYLHCSDLLDVQKHLHFPDTASSSTNCKNEVFKPRAAPLTCQWMRTQPCSAGSRPKELHLLVNLGNSQTNPRVAPDMVMSV